MFWDLTERQKLLQSSAREFLAKYCPIHEVRRVDESRQNMSPALWAEWIRNGWQLIDLPESLGGTEDDLLDQVVVHEELGRVLAPLPTLSSLVLAAGLIRVARLAGSSFGSNSVDQGNVISAALVHLPHNFELSRLDATISQHQDRWQISGTVAMVPYVEVSTLVLVPALVPQEPESIAFALLDGVTVGLSNPKRQEMLGGPPFYTLSLESIPANEVHVFKAGDHLQDIMNVLAVSTILLCAETVGAMERVFELTRDYALSRHQFGKPIGSFQRVQDMVIAMRLDCDAARLAVWAAASAQAERAFLFEASVMKAAVNRAALDALFQAHEVFGGVGFMKEHDLQLFTRVLKVNSLLHGTTEEHLSGVARGLRTGQSRASQHLSPEYSSLAV